MNKQFFIKQYLAGFTNFAQYSHFNIIYLNTEFLQKIGSSPPLVAETSSNNSE